MLLSFSFLFFSCTQFFLGSLPQEKYSKPLSLLISVSFHMGFCILNHLCILIHLFLILIPFTKAIGDENRGSIANSTTHPPPPPPASTTRTTGFKPGIAIIVGILTTVFSITFLLLLYVKHCKRGAYADNSRNHPPSRTHSGIDRKVIESLPMFRFKSLRGQKEGLECAVCLNKFEQEEVLRLLPKCKHAFHVECVDTWLDAHSTCPLCRYRVDPEDVLLLDYNDTCKSLYNNHSNQTTPRNSDQGSHRPARISGRHSSAGEKGSSLEIIVEKPGQDSRGRGSFDSWNSRKKTGNWLNSKSLNSWTALANRKTEKDGGIQGRRSADSCKASAAAFRKDGQLPVQGDKHRLEHRIIISEEEEGQRRWSDVQASDFLYLKSELILGGGEREEDGNGRGVINERSVSEMTGVSRYRSNNEGGRRRGEGEEERVVKRWLDWISQSQQQQKKTAVRSASSSSIVV